ncbi:MAG: hypothetical protein KJ718_01225, partial [Nanoarchaeota archaeon]|nr:hypothetical protein [Nanoarchaeota archaeon]MBU1988019.1 hypothetical protein [Nanoarchaeota archaeon]
MIKKEALGITIFLIFFSAAMASATVDVAYVALTPDYIKQEFIDVLNELSFSYDLVYSNQISSYDFSTVRLILLNNDYFPNWYEIPTNNYPAVIANGRNIVQWGWTKRVTTASQSVPMLIHINTSHELGQGMNEITQVYNHEAPDIYYLDKRDVYDGLDIIGSNIYDNEDAIIAIATEGTILTRSGRPDTHINANSCFFGVTESEYWTNDSKELFKRCINFVAITCLDDSYCPDQEAGDPYCLNDDAYQDILDFHCENPGTSSSMCVDDMVTVLIEDCDDTFETCSDGACVELIIACYDDEDCGINSWSGEETCQNDDVFRNHTSFSCANAGTSSSYCTNSTEFLLIEDCSDHCTEGNCVECSQDEHCPEDFFSDDYCSDNDVFHDFTDYSCVNYQCSSETISELSETCSEDEICSDGECNELTCSSNSDCGENGFSGLRYCDDFFGNVYEDFISYTCHSPGTLESYCTDYSLPILMEYCDTVCFEGECREIGCFTNQDCDDSNPETEDICHSPGLPESFCTNEPIECFVDEDCGTDGFIGDPF